jgi:glycine hydroxymethyltransferase
MDLAHGGHLTHGLKANFSGRLYRFVFYGVDRATETIDYDEVMRIAGETRPKLILAGASAYSRVIDFERFAAIARSVDARFMVDMAHIAGLVAAGCHPSPVPHADIVTTTTHKTLRGPRGGMILCRGELAKAVDRQIFPGSQGGPFMHIIAAKAVCFAEALRSEFHAYQREVVANAAALADALAERGFRIVSGGTDNHLMLVDLTPKGLNGKEAATALEQAGITANKNAIPFDPNPPSVASGIRLGSPAVTTRGMGRDEMRQIGERIDESLLHRDDPSKLAEIRELNRDLCARFPLYYAGPWSGR